jgi:thiol-disulfide isomerase/thioredoxin
MPNQVVVFHQTGCPACHDYLPRFKRFAVKYRSHLNIQVANLARAEKRIQDAALAYKITSIPTTLVLDANDKVLKRKVGSLSDKQMEEIFAFATTG